MANLVVVALPSEMDHVWDVSSEKIPHMTILFLGEMPVENFANIANFVSHASKSIYRFGMDVDRRGKLGDDEADVLFFNNSKWSGYSDIAAFRAHLLNNESIYKAYQSVTQFPEWIPHLTLGHPETPAKPEKGDRSGFYYVNFDRIALWFNDYDGFEYPLKERYLEEVAMSDERTDLGRMTTSRLMHYGVKGMKWGVRRKRRIAENNSSRVTLRRSKLTGNLKARGGVNRKPSTGARRAKVADQIIRKSGTQALSNKELKAYIERMDLEQRADKISKKNDLGYQFVQALLKD